MHRKPTNFLESSRKKPTVYKQELDLPLTVLAQNFTNTRSKITQGHRLTVGPSEDRFQIIDRNLLVNATSREFLNFLFKDPKNIYLLREAQLHKWESDAKPLTRASNISFCQITLNGKQTCCISISFNKNPEIYERQAKVIKGFIDKYNAHVNKTAFIFIGKTDVKFGNFLSYLLKDGSAKKGCAEKNSAPIFFDLFLKYGNTFRINGMINCILFPNDDKETLNLDYASSKQYGLVPEYQGLSPKIRERLYKFNKEFAFDDIQGYHVHTQNCCRECLKAKDIILDLYTYAAMFGQEVLNLNEEFDGSLINSTGGVFTSYNYSESLRSFEAEAFGRYAASKTLPIECIQMGYEPLPKSPLEDKFVQEDIIELPSATESSSSPDSSETSSSLSPTLFSKKRKGPSKDTCIEERTERSEVTPPLSIMTHKKSLS